MFRSALDLPVLLAQCISITSGATKQRKLSLSAFGKIVIKCLSQSAQQHYNHNI